MLSIVRIPVSVSSDAFMQPKNIRLRIIGVAYETLEPGIYMNDIIDMPLPNMATV
jgi:hypothetical protein